MQRLFFINRYFFPDHSATSQILSDLAFHLAGTEREVHVVTSRQIYDDAKARLPSSETINSVHVHRVASTEFGRAALVGRAVDYFSFYRSVRSLLLGLTRPGDILIAKTDPPLISLIAMQVARRKSARLINWLQDIYPELAAELGVPFLRGPACSTLASLRNQSLRAAAANVVVGDLMASKLRQFGVAPERVHVLPNWCDDEEIKPASSSPNPFRLSWVLEGKFVVGYSGNLGRAHDYQTVLGAAERLRNDQNIAFLMIGGGKRFGELATQVKERHLESLFRFVPYQPREMLAQSLAVPDVHWVSLKPQIEGLIVPSKFYGIAAAGKATIVIGASDGEISQLVEQSGSGLVIEPGDSQALAEAIKRLSGNPDVLAAMGARARQLLDAQFTRKRAFDQWRRLLHGLN